MRFPNVLFFIFLAPRSSLGQERHAEVKLSLREFEELFTSATLKDAERRVHDQQMLQKRDYEKKLSELEELGKTRDEDRRHQALKIFPENYQILRHEASGIFNSSSPISGVERDVASFDLEMIFRVIEPSFNWTVVPLVNTTMTVAANWNVFHQDEKGFEFHQVDPVSDSSILLLMKGGQQVLATNKNGLFKVSFNAYTRVGKTRNLNTMGLSSLLYPLSGLSFRIAKNSPASTTRDFSVQPPSSVLHVNAEENYTDLRATLPLTAESFQIRWVDVQEDQQKESEREDTPDKEFKHKTSESGGGTPQMTVNHEVMHTVGEGVLRSLHTLEFSTTTEVTPLNSVSFHVYGERVRVTSVVGHALQGWTSVEANLHNATTSANLIKATFKTSQLTSSVVLHVHTETDRGDSSQATVELPRIECQNVLRQTGQVAVIKDANVEVHEQKTIGLSRVEPSDLSSKLRLNVDRPIVLSYKYLNPQNQAILNVKEHVAIETLEATIDRFHYKAVLTETHTVHSLILTLQSTKLQYLEIFNIPPSASKFTVLVNSVPAKPVKGDDTNEDSILVPLLIGLNPETANQGASLQTSVEMTYISTHEPLGENGTLVLDPPQFDMPVSVSTAHLSLPVGHSYNFTGDMIRVEKTIMYPVPESFRYAKGKRVVRDDYEFTVLDDMFPEDRAEDGALGAVKIATPLAAYNFYFQKLLVLDRGLQLKVIYTKPPGQKSKPKRLLGRIIALLGFWIN